MSEKIALAEKKSQKSWRKPNLDVLKSKKLFWVPWALMAVVLAISLTFGIVDSNQDESASERAASIARTIRCPQCDGETVAESNAPIAQTIRAEIATRVSEGQTDEEIRSFLAKSYGQDVLLIPPSSGGGSAVWIIPIVGIFIALGILGVAFLKWQKELETEEFDELEDNPEENVEE